MSNPNIEKIEQRIEQLQAQRADVLAKEAAAIEAARVKRVAKATDAAQEQLREKLETFTEAEGALINALSKCHELQAAAEAARLGLDTAIKATTQSLFDEGASQAEVNAAFDEFRPARRRVVYHRHETKRLQFRDAIYDLSHDQAPHNQFRDVDDASYLVVQITKR
jgi:DNA repair exonuclease SbcCD ATPase subunit